MLLTLSFTFNDLGIFFQIIIIRLIHGYDIHKQLFVSLDCKVKPKEIFRVSLIKHQHFCNHKTTTTEEEKTNLQIMSLAEASNWRIKQHQVHSAHYWTKLENN